MRKIGLLIIFILIFLSITASAQKIEVNPSSMTIDLVGGQTVTKQITVVWHGEAPVVGFIHTEIEPDGEGFNVTYSENPVILYPDKPKTLDMKISTSIDIMPLNYTITTVINVSIEEVIKYREKKKIVEIENTTRINELLNIIHTLRNKLNQTTNQSEYLPLLNALQDSIDEFLNLTKKEGEKETFTHLYDLTPFVILTIINIVIWVVVCIYIFRLFRLLKSSEKKKEAGEQQRPHDGDNQ